LAFLNQDRCSILHCMGVDVDNSIYMPLALIGEEAISTPKGRFGVPTIPEEERMAAC